LAVTIITSSTSCLPAELVKKFAIKVIPIPFVLDGHNYLDGVDISTAEVYKLLAYKMPFRTSAPSPGVFVKAYEEVLQKSDAALCLTVPPQISMMYDSARDAAKQISAEARIHVMDSGTAGGGQALVDLTAARAAAAGASLEEIIELVRKVQETIHLYGLIVDPQYLVRTGRIPSPLPSAASFFSIKPIFTIGQGKIKFSGVVRSESAGIDRMISIMQGKVGKQPVSVNIQHANAQPAAQIVRRKVEDLFNCNELLITEFSPVIGFATGPGSLALAFKIEN
jgi:DegV family protein with EDD domain